MNLSIPYTDPLYGVGQQAIGFMVYSLTSPYEHLSSMDTSLLQTVHLISEILKIIHSLP